LFFDYTLLDSDSVLSIIPAVITGLSTMFINAAAVISILIAVAGAIVAWVGYDNKLLFGWHMLLFTLAGLFGEVLRGSDIITSLHLWIVALVFNIIILVKWKEKI
jgi:cellulose synthase/poly-beta-1,6-N-acetylglucosamine synthase-like glycosyltransferase